MATTEERMKILQMIQDGKISAEDGAKLLEALNKGAGKGPFPPNFPGPGDSRYLRVRVSDADSGKVKVNVNVPLSLVDAGLGIASNFAPGLDSEKLGDAIKNGMVGKVIDVYDEEDGERVEIYIE